MAQLSLPLTLPEIFSADNFFVSDCNNEAYNTVLNQDNWSGHTIYLYGEKFSGKSHLAYIWAQKTNAKIISTQEINPENIKDNCVVENIESCKNEESLLHLYNHCKDIGIKLLMTSNLAPSALPFTLPDLTSRLRGCQLATINPPDDALISAVMRKQFADRQLLVDDEVISYLTTRTKRTLADVTKLVDTLDKNALAEQRSITIPFAKQLF